MDFSLSEEQAHIFQMARDFAVEKMAPFAAKWEEEERLPRDVLDELAALGMAAITVRDDYGTGLSRLDAALIFEALSDGCPLGGGLPVDPQHVSPGWSTRFGSAEQRANGCRSSPAMEIVASYCLTEPGSGSDAAALKTTAKRDGNGYVLNGAKAFISGAGTPTSTSSWRRTGEAGPKGISALLVEDGTPGLSFGAPERKMGWRAQPTAEVRFEGCRVPARGPARRGGQGLLLRHGGARRRPAQHRRLRAGRRAGGARQGARLHPRAPGLRPAARPSSRRCSSGSPTWRPSCRPRASSCYQAAWKLDQKTPDATRHCAMAKRLVTDTGFEVANVALQLHGGYGYLADYGIEKIVRDLRVHQILEGTNEIMRLIIARALLRRLREPMTETNTAESSPASPAARAASPSTGRRR